MREFWIHYNDTEEMEQWTVLVKISTAKSYVLDAESLLDRIQRNRYILEGFGERFHDDFGDVILNGGDEPVIGSWSITQRKPLDIPDGFVL